MSKLFMIAQHPSRRTAFVIQVANVELITVHKVGRRGECV